VKRCKAKARAEKANTLKIKINKSEHELLQAQTETYAFPKLLELQSYSTPLTEQRSRLTLMETNRYESNRAFVEWVSRIAFVTIFPKLVL